MNVPVTGAAGYVGSVVTERLLTEGHKVIALDNLGQGHRAVLEPEAHLIQANLCDTQALEDVFSQYDVDTVIHLAALSIIPHSVSNPQEYFQVNVVGGLNLLNSMLRYNVTGLVFSSSAGVYGTPANIPVTEDTPKIAIHPYGECQLMKGRDSSCHWYQRLR